MIFSISKPKAFSEASTIFCLLTYLGGCAAALRYRLRGALPFAAIGAVFCVTVIVFSSTPVLMATAVCLGIFMVCYLPLSRRKYLRPDPAVRSGGLAPRDRHDDAR